MSIFIGIYDDMFDMKPDIELEVLEPTDAELSIYNTYKEIEADLNKIDYLIVSNFEIREELLEKMTLLKGIVRAGIGIDNIDIASAKKRGIKVANVPDYCIEEVSNHTVLMALAIVSRLHLYNRDVKNGIWNISSPDNIMPVARQTQKLTLGLLGFGAIARAVAKKASPFFGEIITYDPFVNLDECKKLGVESVDFETVMKTSDVLSIHVPGGEDNYHLINREYLSNMKNGSYIVNTSRGQNIDLDALAEFLKEKKIAGAALDVLEVEPIEEGSILFELDNLILTPHVGFYTQDSMNELRRKSILEILRLINNEPMINEIK